MQDILSAHAARCAKSHDEYQARAKAAREDADEAIREAISALGRRLVDLVGQISVAGVEASSAIEAAGNRALAELRAALDDNLAEIALSTSAAQEELDARREFVATGKLPTGQPLPRAQGVDLAFRDQDAPTAEIVVLKPPAAASDEPAAEPMRAGA